MVDNIKFNKILPSLSPAAKVNRTDPRGRNNQQTPFKESFERKQKKKKEDDPEPIKLSESETSLSAIPRQRHADRKSADRRRRSSDSSRSRLIDIRV
jgi:hypothetical protein